VTRVRRNAAASDASHPPYSASGPERSDTLYTLRQVVEQHRDRCFRDTDGVTRDAGRMLEIMDGWRPNRSDKQAGVTRNRAFDPALLVVVTSDARVSYAAGAAHPGEPSLLFTIVPPDAPRQG
jgi:hypothetical protein